MSKALFKNPNAYIACKVARSTTSHLRKIDLGPLSLDPHVLEIQTLCGRKAKVDTKENPIYTTCSECKRRAGSEFVDGDWVYHVTRHQIGQVHISASLPTVGTFVVDFGPDEEELEVSAELLRPIEGQNITLRSIHRVPKLITM